MSNKKSEESAWLKLKREERQNFDPSGHYSRPDVTQLTVNRQRQSTLVLKD
jgi:nitrilase